MENSLTLPKGRRSKVKRSKTEVAIMTIVFIIFVIYSFTFLFALYWILVNSFKTADDFMNNVFNLPPVWQFQNYIDAARIRIPVVGQGGSRRYTNLSQMFLTSIGLVAAVTVLEVFVSAGTSYVVAKYKFPGRNFLFGMIVFAMVVPLVGTLPVMFQFMNDVRLFDTFYGMLFLYVNGFGFGFLLLFGHFKNLSWSYAEAAAIDGAGEFGIYFRVMLPLSFPSLVAVAIVAAIGYWNDFSTPFIYLPSFPTLAVGIDLFNRELQREHNMPLMFSAMMLAVIPVIVFFAIFQRTIMKNMVAGGLKG